MLRGGPPPRKDGRHEVDSIAPRRLKIIYDIEIGMRNRIELCGGERVAPGGEGGPDVFAATAGGLDPERAVTDAFGRGD